MIKIPKFLAGGKTTQEAQDEGAIVLQVLNAIGIDENTAYQKLQELGESGDEETMQGIWEAVGTIIGAQQGSATEEDANNAVQVLYTIFGNPQESQIFKCGGKMATLVKKHADGKKLSCGCGKKIEKQQNGNVISRPVGDRTITAKDTTDVYTLPSGSVVERKSFVGSPKINYRVLSPWDRTDRWTNIPLLKNKIGVFSQPFIDLGLAYERIDPSYQNDLEATRSNTYFVINDKTKKERKENEKKEKKSNNGGSR